MQNQQASKEERHRESKQEGATQSKVQGHREIAKE